MVLAERSNDVRNGKRSRGPSPNGHGSPDSSSEDENGTKYSEFFIALCRHEIILMGYGGAFCMLIGTCTYENITRTYNKYILN